MAPTQGVLVAAWVHQGLLQPRPVPWSGPQASSQEGAWDGAEEVQMAVQGSGDPGKRQVQGVREPGSGYAGAIADCRAGTTLRGPGDTRPAEQGAVMPPHGQALRLLPAQATAGC